MVIPLKPFLTDSGMSHQHPGVYVTSEEKVLDGVIAWGANKDGIYGWEDANQHQMIEGGGLFQERMEDLKSLLPLVRFPLMTLPVLQMVSHSPELGIYEHYWTTTPTSCPLI